MSKKSQAVKGEPQTVKSEDNPTAISPAAAAPSAPQETLPEKIDPTSGGVPSVFDADDIPTGYDTLGPGDFVIPRMKIVQPSSKEGTAGTFRMNLTTEEFWKLRIVAIKAEPGRVYWEKDSDNETPLCRSYDGRVPDPAIEEPPGQICVEPMTSKGGKQILQPVCSMAQWGENRERPACDSIYNVLCVSIQDDLPFWLTIGGTSITNFKKFVSSIALRRRKLCEFESEISLEEETNKKGRFFVLKFSVPKLVEGDFRDHVLDLVRTFRNETVQRTYEAEAASEVDIGEGPAADANGDPGPQGMPGWMEE